jgi:hypothetical protein
MSATANFSVQIYRERFTFLAITDLDEPGYPSVTNDIENVLAALLDAGLLVTGRLVIYRDSMGVWDQVIIDDRCQFKHFKSLNARTASDAIARVINGTVLQ